MIFRYWGKADKIDEESSFYHLLPYHCLDAAAVAKLLLEKHKGWAGHFGRVSGLDLKTISSWLAYLIALHDIGKFSEAFQNLKPKLMKTLQGSSGKKEYSMRHDSIGFLLWRDYLNKNMIQTLSLIGNFENSDELDCWGEWFDALLQSVTGHHGKPPEISSKPLDFFCTEHDKKAALQYALEAADIILPKEKTVPSWSAEEGWHMAQFLSWHLAGLTVLSDWIASNPNFFELVQKEMPLEKYWKEIAIPSAQKAVAKVGILPQEPAPHSTFKKLFTKIKKPTPLQELSQSLPIVNAPQLFIIEEATGGGKTEAAVMIAHRLITSRMADGIYIALPTMATANSMYERTSQVYRKLFAKGANPSLILAHGANRLNDGFQKSIIPISQCGNINYSKDETTAEAECSGWLTDNKKKSLFAHVGVGTIDQALLAILNAKHQSLRMLGLLGKVLIVDEVHANDSYMHSLLKKLLEFHSASGGSAILLSATLPKKMRQELITSFSKGLKGDAFTAKSNSYPLLTHCHKSALLEKTFNSRKDIQRTLKLHLINSTAYAEELILKELKAGHCVCWIRNTVIDATESYKPLLKKIPEENLIFFHARFAMSDRLDIENKVTKLFGSESSSKNRKGKVVIATQVVEQSLDIDFDFMISDLAPIDLLIQRAGRLKRHTRDKAGNRIFDGKDKRSEPELFVLSPSPIEEADEKWFENFSPKSAPVYPNHGQLWLSAKLIETKKAITIPDDLRYFIETVYSDESEEKIPEGLQGSNLQSYGRKSVEASHARANSINIDEGYQIPLSARWQEEIRAVTRLGEPTVTLRLARWEGGRLTPWCKADKHEWQLSQVSVRQYLVSGEKMPDDTDIKSAVAELKKRWGKSYSILVVLTKKDGERWQGEAVDEKGESVLVNYSEKYGLEV